ncbi:MAG: hypothetical protein EOM20_17255 [Spartobacteria bacterium]|nr:hypothetical protein [Spartobacteria bacterium]
MSTNSSCVQKISAVRLAPPRCTLGITDGSERGDYVPQEHMFTQIGRPHHVVNLMFQYYPDLEGWPTQGVKWRGFYRNNQLNKGDGYFPLALEEGGPWSAFFKRQIEDVRAYGQEPQLTLTLHADTPDETLVRIAQALAPYGQMRIRINHECNGCWFYFNQRWSYKEVSDLFIRFHHIIHEHAPFLKTVACWNGKGEAYNEPEGKAANGGQLTDDQLGPMFKTADIVSYDQYASLHYGWPNPHFDPAHPDEYFKIPLDVWWDLVDEVHDEMSELRGEDTDIEIHEINEDADLLGFDGQAEWIRKYYQEAVQRNYPWLKNITFYMFRDRGGLGLEQEDVEDPAVYTELPSLAAYREATDHEMFKLNILPGDPVHPAAPTPMRWVGTCDATGLGVTCPLPPGTERIKLILPADQHLLVNAGKTWMVKKAGSDHVILPVTGDAAQLSIFAPPPDGRDNTHGAYETTLATPPVIAPA